MASTPSGPAATDQLRRLNTALVLRRLRSSGPASRAELAQATGLAKATVGTIVAELVRHRVAREPAASEPPADAGAERRIGRPGRPVELDGAHLVALGLEVNVDYVAATAVDLAGRTVLTARETLASSQSPLLRVSRLARRCLARLLDDGRDVIGVGVAVPGLVDHDDGHVVTAPNLGWTDLPLRAALLDALPAEGLPAGYPLRVDNDANAAAIAEATWGAGRGRSPVLYLTGTVGLGAGLVVDGVAQRGASGFAGEVGHIALGDPDRRCACGRTGCWETTVGLSAMLRTVGMPADDGRTGDPVQAAAAVAERARREPAVATALGEVARSLAAGVATLVGILDPEVVVLGGYFVPLGPWLLPGVRHTVSHDVLAGSSRRCTVDLSTLGLHAASAGAAADVLADVFDGTLPVTP